MTTSAFSQHSNGHSENAGIAGRAVLTRLKLTGWSEMTFDKETTQEVADNFNVQEGVGRYMKRLLTKSATAEVKSLASDARKTHYELTMPWDDNGTRILPIEAFEKYKTKMEHLRERRTDAVNRLINDYERHLEDAKDALGGLFKIEEYPTREQLRESYSMSWEFSEVTDGRNFIADLPQEERERIRREIEERVHQRINAGVEDLYHRLAKHIAAAKERLTPGEDGKEKVFRDTMVTNLKELLENIPLLNVTNDARLNRMCDQLTMAVNDMNADNLRPKSKHFSSVKRENFRSAIEEMSEQFAGYF